jgi:hypothetical protein
MIHNLDSKNKKFVCLTCLILFITILLIIDLSLKKYEETYENYILLNDSCKDYLLNIHNPKSYINSITKPFLIELVNNATRNG